MVLWGRSQHGRRWMLCQRCLKARGPLAQERAQILGRLFDFDVVVGHIAQGVCGSENNNFWTRKVDFDCLDDSGYPPCPAHPSLLYTLAPLPCAAQSILGARCNRLSEQNVISKAPAIVKMIFERGCAHTSASMHATFRPHAHPPHGRNGLGEVGGGGRVDSNRRLKTQGRSGWGEGGSGRTVH